MRFALLAVCHPVCRVSAVAEFDIQQIAERCFPRIHRAALVMTGNPWDADDLAQETFLVLSREIGRFRGGSSIDTWLYGILLNLDRQERRRSGVRRHKLRVLWANGNGIEPTSPAAESPIEVTEWKRSLWGRVAELPQNQRHALVLRFSEQLRYDEIAEVLACPLGTVKSRIFHGLAALRELMQAEGREAAEVPRELKRDIHHAI
jgi:RNA polymerase sigma-70 factor, ECF subfamily